jgi:hypothetical protein
MTRPTLVQYLWVRPGTFEGTTRVSFLFSQINYHGKVFRDNYSLHFNGASNKKKKFYKIPPDRHHVCLLHRKVFYVGSQISVSPPDKTRCCVISSTCNAPKIRFSPKFVWLKEGIFQIFCVFFQSFCSTFKSLPTFTCVVFVIDACVVHIKNFRAGKKNFKTC